MRRFATLAPLILTACPPPSAWDIQATYVESSSGGSTTGSTGSTDTEGSSGGSTATVEGAGTGSTGSTGGDPVVLPTIVSIELGPDPIEAAGPIAVQVQVKDGDGATMALDGAAPVPLAAVNADTYVGEIAVASPTFNGMHTAKLTPMRADIAGEPQSRSFAVELPASGTLARWEVSVDLDEALGEAIAVAPDGKFYEFGTSDPAGVPQCYLRRRGPNGEYGPDDLLAELVPGALCRAKKLGLDADGRLFLLAEVEQAGLKRWWLGRKDSWDSPVESLLWGQFGEIANGLAVRDDGRAAVCGTVKTIFGDLDALVAVYDDGGATTTKTLDFVYDGNNKMPHSWDEVVYDCTFAEGVLVGAGELWGEHPNDVPMERSRHMVFEDDADETVWNIADQGPGLYVQSGARALSRIPGGGYVTAGYVCGDPCIPQLYLREFLAGVEYVDDFMPAVKTTAPTDIAYSPAGYVVVTAARNKGGWWTDFWAQAWVPGAQKEEWSFARSDEMTTHLAQGVAIGKYGRVHLVGVAEQAGLYRPVIALLHP